MRPRRIPLASIALLLVFLASACALEKHAYQIKDYYRKTQPAKPTL